MKPEFKNIQERVQFWKSHVEKAMEFGGSELEYCRQNQLNPSTFHGYKQRLGFVKSKVKKPSQGFARIDVIKDSSDKPQQLRSMSGHEKQGPSAVWLASFVSEMMKLKQL